VFRNFLKLSFVLFLFGCVQGAKPTETKVERQCVNKPLIVGHRGASGYVPEHTLRSYELAIEMGADFIEPDLVMTKDRVLIVRHENEISETTDVATKFPKRKTKKSVDGKETEGWFSEDFTLAEIKQLKTKERLPTRSQELNGKFEIPTFEEVLTFAALQEKKRGRRIGIVPEIKHSTYFRERGLAMEEPLVNLLKKYDRLRNDGRTLVQSFEVENLKRLRRLTSIELVQLIDDPGLVPFDVRQMGGKKTYLQMVTADGFSEIKTYADWVSPHKSYLLNTEFVKQAHAVGLKVMPYTFREEGDYAAYFELGIDGLFTDFPDRAQSAWRAFSEIQDSLCKQTTSPVAN
jgi:glycerophosphoryl diester phosphodiesterase